MYWMAVVCFQIKCMRELRLGLQSLVGPYCPLAPLAPLALSAQLVLLDPYYQSSQLILSYLLDPCIRYRQEGRGRLSLPLHRSSPLDQLIPCCLLLRKRPYNQLNP